MYILKEHVSNPLKKRIYKKIAEKGKINEINGKD